MTPKKKLKKKVATEKPKPPSLLERLQQKLTELGLTARKSSEIAKGLAPAMIKLVKADEKAKEKAKEKARKAKENRALKSGYLDEKVENGLVPAGKPQAVAIDGHRLRLDLPVAPMRESKGIELLRVMDGLTTHATYLVAAVKGEEGIVAVRRLGSDWFNVKFYPDMAFWRKTPTELSSLGAMDGTHLKREWYERQHFSTKGLEQVLMRLAAEATPASKVKAMAQRWLALAVNPLVKAFDILYSRGTKQVAS